MSREKEMIERSVRGCDSEADLRRRRFVQGALAGGVALALAPAATPLRAEERMMATGSAPVLAGTEFDLVIAETPVNFSGRRRMAVTINGSLPGPTLRWREGDTITLRVTNRLSEPTSIHWHGIILPYEMDGVPGISFAGIAPGTTFTYRFTVQQSGSYWYHSHSGMQEQRGMYGAIIIEPRSADPVQAERDQTIILSDWSDEEPMAIMKKLKMQGDYYNYNQPTLFDFIRDVGNDGLGAALAKRRMWQQMRMNPTDLSDISAQTYTYLLNGMTAAGNWTTLFKPGERLRLRFVNGASQTFFDVRIPGLPLTVVQSDGVNVEPVVVDEFRIAPGETYDVIVTPRDEAYTLFAQTMDRTGYVRGTLATREGAEAAVPAVDKVQWLEMDDMMGAMSHGAAHGEHAAHGAAAAVVARHASSEYGASVDMRVDMPRTNLDDPGVGLRNNGRRVLTLADLRTLGGPIDTRAPERELEMHLTGNMERYSWSIDGIEFGKSTPIHFKHNERIRVILHNDTMMSHPMHLHGMWSDLETPTAVHQVRKHTIVVQPAQRLSFLVTADALGRWAWHCHLMYHMDAGMFREVVVA